MLEKEKILSFYSMIKICQKLKQPSGYTASIPCSFPVKGMFDIPQELLSKAIQAERTVGKLDGIIQILPNINFFLKMYSLKDASSSAQIEGTKATMADAIELEAGIDGRETDAQDILFYTKALDYGIQRIQEFPISLRFIRELHGILMKGARSTHFSDPGEFRKTQNWLGGTSLANASFVPPPAENMKDALHDFENFLYNDNIVFPIVHIAYAHAQFETIHPFLDGNGRTGRLLITFLLYKKGLLEKPVLFLASFFKKHQQLYYQKLHDYHEGDVLSWLDFFLEGVIETANSSIEVSKKIRAIRDADMEKIQALAKRESESGVLVLSRLYKTPIVTTKIIMNWTGFTRSGSQRLIDRFIDLNILKMEDQEDAYDRKYIYENYIRAFIDEE